MSASIGGSISATNGSFVITDKQGKAQQVDLGTLMMMLNLNRTETLDKKIALQLDDIQKRNDLVRNLTEFLSQARTFKADGTDDNCNITLTITTNGVTSTVTKPMGGNAADSFAKDFGITWADVGTGRASQSGDTAKQTWDTKFDGNIGNIKSKIETLNSDSQMDNIKLQNLLEKRNNAFEMATKVLDTNNQSVESVIRNL
jgi:hypothetical protein